MKKGSIEKKKNKGGVLKFCPPQFACTKIFAPPPAVNNDRSLIKVGVIPKEGHTFLHDAADTIR